MCGGFDFIRQLAGQVDRTGEQHCLREAGSTPNDYCLDWWNADSRARHSNRPNHIGKRDV